MLFIHRDVMCLHPRYLCKSRPCNILKSLNEARFVAVVVTSTSACRLQTGIGERLRQFCRDAFNWTRTNCSARPHLQMGIRSSISWSFCSRFLYVTAAIIARWTIRMTVGFLHRGFSYSLRFLRGLGEMWKYINVGNFPDRKYF